MRKKRVWIFLIKHCCSKLWKLPKFSLKYQNLKNIRWFKFLYIFWISFAFQIAYIIICLLFQSLKSKCWRSPAHIKINITRLWAPVFKTYSIDHMFTRTTHAFGNLMDWWIIFNIDKKKWSMSTMFIINQNYKNIKNAAENFDDVVWL